MRKSYFALFTCCVTRAVHLELVVDLSVETFKSECTEKSSKIGKSWPQLKT